MFRWSLLICALLMISCSLTEAENSLEIQVSEPPFDLVLLMPPAPLVSADPRPLPCHIVVPHRYAEMVQNLSEKHGVSWQLVAALMKAESNFKSRAISTKGARGLMQLTPRTASRYKVSAGELYDPYKNIEAGVQHLRMLIDRYAGNLDLAIAAYNTGEFAVDRHRGIPPFRTTRLFVKKVLNQYLAWL